MVLGNPNRLILSVRTVSSLGKSGKPEVSAERQVGVGTWRSH